MNENEKKAGAINGKMIGGMFLVLLFVLLFFSKTIYSNGLPAVTAVLPQNGTLNKTETASGVVDWSDVEEMYAALGGKVDEVFVEEGDEVTEGQPLVQLWFDEESINSKLKEIAVSRSKLAADIETIRLRMEKTRRTISDLEQESYDKDTVSEYELERLKSSIEKAEEEYRQMQSLYDVGGLSAQEIDNKAYEIDKLNKEYENLLQTRAENDRKADKEITEKEKERSKKIRDYEHELQGYEQDLKAKELDLAGLAIQEDNYRKTLSDYGDSEVIKAKADGVIISVPINAGQLVNAGQPVASIGVGSAYKVEYGVALENNFIAMGDECTLTNSSHAVDGVVTKITPEANQKTVTVEITSDEISTGETFEVEFVKESVKAYALVPNGAVNMDNDGYFLYQIKKRKGILGEEYYAEKLTVYIGDSDNENTIVTKGLGFYEPIVLLSDKPVSDGATIQVKNAGDFFAE